MTARSTMGPYPGRLLFLGTIGLGVRQVQQCLGNVTVNGIFNTDTRNAVMEFQRKSGFVQDGIVGPVTWARLQQVCGSAFAANIAEPAEDTSQTMKNYLLAYMLHSVFMKG